MDPVAFEVGPLTIRWYGIFVALAFLVGMAVVNWRAPRRGISRDSVMDIAFWTMAGGILGARVLYVLQNWSDFRSTPLEIIRIDHGGLVFYGGFIGAFIVAAVAVRIKNLAAADIADIFAPALPAAHVLGRIGCFLNGCCFGRAWHGPCAVHYPPDGAVHQVQQSLGVAAEFSQYPQPVFPVQLLAAALNAILFILLLLIEPRLRYRGQLLALYVVLYSIIRFSVELGRGDYLERVGVFTPAQILCLILLPLGIAAFFSLRRPGFKMPTPTGTARGA